MNKATIPWNAKQVSKMFDNDSLKFDNAIQRAEVWDTKRKSLFVDTMLRGYPVPPIFTIKTDEEVRTPKGLVRVFDCIDGKQRCTTINQFKNDGFALTGVMPITLSNGDEVELNGLTYSQFPEELKDEFDSFSMTVYYFDDIGDDEICEMMDRLNNGKPFTGVEKARIKAKDLDTIKELANHDLFNEYLTEKAISGYANEDIVIKTYIQLFRDEPCFDTKTVKEVYTGTTFDKDEAEQMTSLFDKIRDILTIIEDNAPKSVYRKCIKKTNMLAIIYLAANDNYESADNDAEFIMNFFDADETSISEQYNDASTNGTNHTAKVKARNEAILNCFNERS